MTDKMKIVSIKYNWCQVNDGCEAGEDYEYREVGKRHGNKTVVKIEEATDGGEDNYVVYYKVHFDSGVVEYIFNINKVDWVKIEDENKQG